MFRRWVAIIQSHVWSWVDYSCCNCACAILRVLFVLLLLPFIHSRLQIYLFGRWFCTFSINPRHNVCVCVCMHFYYSCSWTLLTLAVARATNNIELCDAVQKNAVFIAIHLKNTTMHRQTHSFLSIGSFVPQTASNNVVRFYRKEIGKWKQSPFEMLFAQQQKTVQRKIDVDALRPQRWKHKLTETNEHFFVLSMNVKPKQIVLLR